jgi:uncharacterized protein YyaL (SSP411 family)
MTGSGGWPLSLFLFPDGRPFYGGTYFPPDDRYGRPGFLTLLASISRAWKTRRTELADSARELFAHLEKGHGIAAGGEVGPEVLESAARALTSRFDEVHGGFDGAPKFPPAMRLELLIRYWLRTGEPRARTMVETTLTRMAEGGMYDQVGGGFHRYSVDARWLVPHFEKMLYDNALLARVYLLASRAFDAPPYARVARETFDYLLREMTPEEGGFYAAQDADSEGQEGTFYVWDPESLEAAVGREDAPLVAARFGITPEGNFEHGRTVLSAVRGFGELAAEFGLSEERVAEVIASARERMYAARSRRVWPGTDEKLLTDWTALAISAFSLGARLLGEPRYEAAARKAADRILEKCRRGGELLHREKDGVAGIPGFSSDYAFAIEAFLDLYEATFEARYFRAALDLQEAMDDRFADEAGGYYLAAASHDGLILRPKESLDGATPSSNSVAAMNLLRLGSFTGEAKYRDAAERLLEAFSGYLTRAGLALPRMLCAVDYRFDAVREIVLSGERGREDFESLRSAVFSSRRLNRVLAHADASATLADVVPLVAGRQPEDGRALAYVCRNFACGLPTADPAQLRSSLDA